MIASYQGNMEGAKAGKWTSVTFKEMGILIFKERKCIEYQMFVETS